MTESQPFFTGFAATEEQEEEDLPKFLEMLANSVLSFRLFVLFSENGGAGKIPKLVLSIKPLFNVKSQKCLK